MIRVVLIGGDEEQVRKLSSILVESNFTCSAYIDFEQATEKLDERPPDVVLLAVDGANSAEAKRLAVDIKEERQLPLVALLPREALGTLDSPFSFDDFVVEPWDPREVSLRVKRVLWKNADVEGDEIIRCGDLIIDLSKCETIVRGKVVPLTFKEFELLRFLAANKGKVFSRQTLLNRIWGYDYFGGDRTVDVHIRRLRSKIEDTDESFIETVRNMGYKFKESHPEAAA